MAMAAIIAQIARRRRENAAPRRKKYEISKCLYDLPPFDPHFDPLLHNNYSKRRAIYLDRKRRDQQNQFCSYSEKKKFIAFKWKRFFFEILLIGKVCGIDKNNIFFLF